MILMTCNVIFIPVKSHPHKKLKIFQYIAFSRIGFTLQCKRFPKKQSTASLRML